MGLGQRFAHSIASPSEPAWISQKPAISSCAGANGPVATVRFAPEKRTRAPLELGCSPSPASSAPAFASSSLYLPIAARSSSFGITPASDSVVALTIIMKRTAASPCLFGSRPEFGSSQPVRSRPPLVDVQAGPQSTSLTIFFGRHFPVAAAGPPRPPAGRGRQEFLVPVRRCRQACIALSDITDAGRARRPRSRRRAARRARRNPPRTRPLPGVARRDETRLPDSHPRGRRRMAICEVCGERLRQGVRS